MVSGDLPSGAVPRGNSLEFTDATIPSPLLRDHALGAGHWGLLHVLEGSITFVDTASGEELPVSAVGSVVIRPLSPHRVVVHGRVRCRIDFYVEQDAA